MHTTPIHKPRMGFVGICAAIIIALIGVSAARADDADLAKALSNPLASMISVPFQFNYNQGSGQPHTEHGNGGDQLLLNIQPVIPISLNDEWNLISRTILPVIYQHDTAGSSGTQFGLGDTVQSLWFSPVKPTSFGLIWGVGPAIYLPTSTDSLLGVGEWGAGPTVVGLVQEGPWTIGFLGNHIWSFDSDDINSTYMQPFLNYTTPTAWTFGLNTESVYNWTTSEWTIPINATISKLVTIGGQRVSLQAGGRYYAESKTAGAEGWGGRLSVTLLFPKK